MLVEVEAWQGGEVSSTRQCNHVYRRQGRSVRWCEQDSSAGQSRSRSRSRLSRALKAETAGEAEAVSGRGRVDKSHYLRTAECEQRP